VSASKNNVPEGLRRHASWLLWRFEQYPDENKPRKIPYYASGRKRVGKQGSAEDVANMTSFDTACEVLANSDGHYDGIGFAPRAEHGLLILDFDNCIEPDGHVNYDVAKIATQTYSEVTPSGKGLRSVFEGHFPNRKSPTTGNAFGFETFCESGFVTITGDVLDLCELMGSSEVVSKVTPAVEALCAARFEARTPQTVDTDDFMLGRKPPLGLTVDEMETLLDQLCPDMGREDWIKIGMALHHETQGDDTGFEMWNDFSSLGEKYPSEEALRAQWDSFERRKGDRRPQVTMATVKHMVNQLSRAPIDEAKRLEMMARAEPRDVFRTPDNFGGKYRIETIGDLELRPPSEWLIKGVLPRGDLIFLYGASGSGKSFIALDMGLALARGVDWRGRKTKRCRVLYIAAEGEGGVHKRIAAYCKFHNIDPKEFDFAVITAAPNIMESDDIGELLDAIEAAGGKPDLIIADTLAQMTPGANENSGEDMGLALRNLRTLRNVSGATVMAVHHAGKDASKGARGWSGMRAAVDAELEVVKHENGSRELRVTKMKDGDDSPAWGFKLEVIDLGFDLDGDPITSCVAIDAELPKQVPNDATSSRPKRYGKHQTHAIEMMATVDPKIDMMMVVEFANLCADALPAPASPDKRDTRRQDMGRAIRLLGREKDAPFEVRSGYVIFHE
jgi:hypothetical protein